MPLDSESENASIRAGIYFDCICGLTSGILSISCILYYGIISGYTLQFGFYASLVFWVIILIFSIFLLSHGLYTRYLEKHPEKRKTQKDLKPPII